MLCERCVPGGNGKIRLWEGLDVNIGFYMCIGLVPVFWLIAVLMFLLKEKGAILMAGFNALPEHEQKRYDRRRIALDVQKQYGFWGLLFLAGAGLCLLISGYVAILVYGIWIVLFFKDVHLTPEKAFEKYRIK